MADVPTKREVGTGLLRALSTGGAVTLPFVGATEDERKAAQAELEFRAGVRSTRPEPGPEAKGTSDDADHERVMFERSIAALRERADQADAEALDAYFADKVHQEHRLRAEAVRLRALADRHEATLKLRHRGKP